MGKPPVTKPGFAEGGDAGKVFGVGEGGGKTPNIYELTLHSKFVVFDKALSTFQ